MEREYIYSLRVVHFVLILTLILILTRRCGGTVDTGDLKSPALTGFSVRFRAAAPFDSPSLRSGSLMVNHSTLLLRESNDPERSRRANSRFAVHYAHSSLMVLSPSVLGPLLRREMLMKQFPIT